MSGRLRVHSPGMLTTVQDAGRFGHEHRGVPPSGAMDAIALRIANIVVGNPSGAAALEMTVQGGRYEVLDAPCTVCIAGGVTVLQAIRTEGGSRALAPWQAHRLLPGTLLSVGLVEHGVRAYLAVAGGIAVPAVVGSASTLTRAGLGGFDGRALQQGDVLPIGTGHPPARRRRCAPGAIESLYRTGPIGVVLGPQDDHFAPEEIERFLASPYTVTPQADRMGYRLAGPVIAHRRGADIVSDAIVAGSIQVPGSGQPIVALHDRQTTGGYPKIATVIAADLPRLGQFRPGQALRFEAVSLPTAVKRWRTLQKRLCTLEQSLRADPDFSIFPLFQKP